MRGVRRGYIVKWEVWVNYYNIVHEEIGSYIGYGIRYGEHTVTDISLDRAKIENLIERMNSNELSPLHMMDIIEDFLAEDSNFFSCN